MLPKAALRVMINEQFCAEDDVTDFIAFLAKKGARNSDRIELMTYVRKVFNTQIDSTTEDPMSKRIFTKALDVASGRIKQYIETRSLAKWPVSDADLGEEVSQFVKSRILKCWDRLEQEYLLQVQSVQARPSPIPVPVSPSVNEVKLQVENQHLCQEIEKLRKEKEQLAALQKASVDAPPPYCVDEAAVTECLLSGQHKVSQIGNSKDENIIPKRSSSTGVSC